MNVHVEVHIQHSSVEQLVVQLAQGQAVVRVVRAVQGEPVHVGGVDADRGAVGLPVEPAERALPVPRLTVSSRPPTGPGHSGGVSCTATSSGRWSLL